MDPTQTFQEFHTYLAVSAPLDLDAAIGEIEAFYPDIMKIVQKDAAFFDTPRMLFGTNLSDVFDSADAFWKNMLMCIMASFFHGDIKQKLGTIMNTVKSVWSASGQTNDEVDRLLNDDSTKGHVEELIEYVTNLRSAKMFLNIIETIDIGSLDIRLDDPTKLVEMVRNPDNPVMQKCIETVQRALKQKLERGEFTQHQLHSDIEGVKAKVQSLFGNMFTEALGGRRADVPSAVMMSNSPEARRQRMLARLQRKQQEKTKP
jgi:hypothetical protein